ncbi:MAG TPA: hypothetical protein VF219_21890 [Vicinamibacterales bacterium]|jgi:hypothetical protein
MLALACPVCFGDASSPMTIAANNGIWFMLAVVAVMLTAFASFFIYLIRRGRLAARQADVPDARTFGSRPGQEGTVQC